MTPLLLVLYVDLERAIPEVGEGRAVKAALEEEHRRATERIRAREEQLERISDPARYDSEAARIAEETAKEEHALEAKQDRLLAPIVEKMRQLADEAKLIDLSEHPLIDPPKECDWTDWLVHAYAKRSAMPQAKEGCRFQKMVYVDFDRALAQSDAGKSATKRLDAFQEKGQAEIDRRQRQLAEIERELRAGQKERRRQYELERREVAQLYARYRKKMEEQARDAQDQLYGQLRRKLAEAAQRAPRLLFVQAIEDQIRLTPHCDASDWAAQWMDGKAGLDELHHRCPVE